MNNKDYKYQKSLKKPFSTKLKTLINVYILTLAITSNTATAAETDNQDITGPIPIPNPITIAMRSKAMIQHLKLTTQQQLAVDIALTKVELPLWKLRDSSLEVRTQSAAPLLAQLNSDLEQTLTPKQFLRLKQVLWQAKGLTAILEPEVTEQLKLTPKQSTSIRILLLNLEKAIADARNKPPYETEIENQHYFRTLYSQTENNIISSLTQSQIRSYSNLYGPVFDISKIPPVACKAPPLITQTWINAVPFNPSNLKGKVTVVHFYAFDCINCKNNLPFYNAWQKKFSPQYFQIIGVHTPETQAEQKLKSVKKEAEKADMNYAIAVDENKTIWNAWANQMWPSIYIIDKNGFVRFWWYGELNYKGAESEKWMREKIIELIKENPPTAKGIKNR